MKQRQQFEGIIVSNAMQKTVVVEVTRFATHPRYHKRIQIRKRFKAHDEKNTYKVGDKVIIESAKPISKEKHWRVIKSI